MAGKVVIETDNVGTTERYHDESTAKSDDLESQVFLPKPNSRVSRRPTAATVDAALSDSDSSLEEIPTKKNSAQHQVPRLLFGAAGIYSAYLYYGHIQEDLFKYRSTDSTSFQSVWLLQSLECFANIFVGLVGRRIFGGRANLSLRPFIATGCSQVFAKAFTSLALAAGLSFPVCILAKSAKIVLVMLGQLLLGGSKYGLRDLLFVLLIVCGTALLSAGSSQKHKDETDTPAGLCFILISLVMDGITAGFQKRLKQTYRATPPSTYDFLLYTNLAMCVVALSISVVTQDLITGLLFLGENPVVAGMIWKVCLCSAIGQSFIFFVVATFDPMVCSTITTTRKMLSVLWSVISKGHVLSNQGSVGLALAMSGLVLEVQGKFTKLSKECEKQAKICVKNASTK
ncbi:hypothetical protein FisN_17Hh151 [Fistulifera solaris]|uniref:Solute carrier family 35 (UDP-galactose transporter), member B1 n=1 Tax=Fistulifera solaris TaxID=1519565 RepID=A0A1Z5JGU9_FISSO|nr:hypothetical protein FisN_17Hh151 [Fistulifera solaris]|eukprot:GAX13219.1 hypothetical protein FisN_17Hh151 [Fistulifera solaris]